MEDESAVVLHYSQLLKDSRSVSCQLEALRRQHETHLSELGQKNAEIEEGEDATLLMEAREGALAESFNLLSTGIQDANLVEAIIEYIEYGEGERAKLKAQVRRLADENGWLRQELQKCQQSLQESEVELCKVQEEKEQLSYLVNLPQVKERADVNNENVEEEEEEEGEDVEREDKSGKKDRNEEKRGGDSDESHYQKLHQYALQHMHQGRHDVAVSLCKKAVQELERTAGRYHPERANMLNVMVVIYREQGKLKESVKLLQEVLEIREKINGSTHQTVASTLNNLSVLHGKLGEHRTAEDFCRRALEIRQKLLGPNHPDVAQQLINLATLCQHLGKYEEVEWYYQRALEIYHTEYGPDDPRVTKTLNYLGKCYMKQGKLEAAESIFKKVRTSVQAQESSIGRDSREHSSSPTSMLGRITPPLPVLEERRHHTLPSPKRSASAHRLQGISPSSSSPLSKGRGVTGGGGAVYEDKIIDNDQVWGVY
uniref:Kinesin light chain n=1 Tax=Amphimedon queenslandica TaxID=400682 RepID=A0A1X7UMA2_AMPQE